MNGDFSRGSLWFNPVTRGQTRHTGSCWYEDGWKMGLFLGSPFQWRTRQLSQLWATPAPAPQKGLVALREAWGAHLMEEEPSRAFLAAQTLLKCWPTMILGGISPDSHLFSLLSPSLNPCLLLSHSQTELFGCWEGPAESSLLFWVEKEKSFKCENKEINHHNKQRWSERVLGK